MSSKKTLARNLFNFIKTSSRTSVMTRMRRTKPGIASDPGDSGILRRFLHRRAFIPPAVVPAGGTLTERLRELNSSRVRIRLDEILPPSKAEDSLEFFPAVTVEDAKKLMRVAEMEMVKSRLREVGKNWVPYSEFVRICGEACSDPEYGIRVANKLDESGNVIVLGNFVCLKPKELTRVVGGLIPTDESCDDVTKRQELEKLMAMKSEIDKTAELMVRRELWAGLGLLMAQTIGFFRLTFWELSWDVMEPICFYVTSSYFMAGYAFFLNTSKEPSFESFYKSRFDKKQKRLMQLRHFDVNRYYELLKMFRP